MDFKTAISVALILNYGIRNVITDYVSKLNVIKSKLINKDKRNDSVDWRTLNKVTPVKDQGACNVCWAFSTVANIESQLLIHLGRQEILSEQFLVDCTPNKGCQDIKNNLQTFAYIVTNLGGVLRDSDYYPYENQKMRCRWSRSGIRGSQIVDNNHTNLKPLFNDVKPFWNSYASPVPVIGFKRVKNDEDIMADYVYNYGPLSAGINSKSMDKYTKGINEPTDDECDPQQLDHAVLIVGYSSYVAPDTGKVTPYWIIKNSWGTNWGDSGYYYLVRGRNACGIANEVSIAFVN